jgi:predicted porin
MKKKLLAVAVAGALAAPGLALAQSSVTISGIFKVSLENLRIGSPGAGRIGANTSENRVADDSSRILFNVVEDLGGGLQAIGQADLRMPMASGNVIAMSGNTHVGLRSASLGRVIIGRQDVHYGNTDSDLSVLAGDLRADSISLLAYMANGVAIANATRTPNIIHYTTPNFSGFTAIVAYSTGPTGSATGQPNVSNVGAAAAVGATAAQQSDLASTIRKGSAFTINPNYAAANWQVGYSYWKMKPDGGQLVSASAAQLDQKSSKLYGSFKIAGFKIGLSWDKSTLTGNTGATAGVKTNERTAWSLPISYIMGNNGFHFHYTKARDDKVTAVQDGAKMVALSYQYTLSKRTSVGLTYAKITNDVGAAYNFFTSTSLGNSTPILRFWFLRLVDLPWREATRDDVRLKAS